MEKLFSQQDRFLFYEVADGWEPLTSFLGLEGSPTVPFPRSDGSDDVNKMVSVMKVLSLFHSLLPVTFFGIFRPAEDGKNGLSLTVEVLSVFGA